MTEQSQKVREGGFWGIVVIFSAFFIQVIAFGTSQSIGIYNIEFLRVFDTGSAAVSLVGSINLGMFLGAGPLCSVLMARWSHRQVALLGAVLSNLGLIVMPFAPNLPFMYAFYGFLTGLGYCLVYVPSHILCGLYYSKHRSLSTGVATAGSGFGSTIFPIIIFKLIQHYGWRGSLLILASCNLHLFFFALLLRPVPKGLLRAYFIKEKRDSDAEDLLKTDHDRHLNGRHKNDMSSSSNDMSSPQHNNGMSSPSKLRDEADIFQLASHDEHYVNGNHDNADSSPSKYSNNCANYIEKDENGTTYDAATSAMLNKSNKSPDKIKQKSTSRILLEHFQMVFTFDFSIFWLSNTGWNAGGGILMIFLPKYMTTVGLGEEDASLAIAVFGAGSCVGCVVGGMLGNIKCINRILLYIAGNIGSGLLTFLFSMPYFHFFVGQLFLVISFGFMFGIILGLLVVVTSDLLGTQALGYGFGYLMLANGIGIFCGPPLAGALIDSFGYQEPAIYLSGAFTFFGGIVMCIVPFRQCCCSGDYSFKRESAQTSIEF